MRHNLLNIIVIALIFVSVNGDANAQCAMCKGAAEMNLKQGGGDPQGLNNGILYMLSLPYLLVGAIGVWWWRNRKKSQEQVSEFSENDFAQYE
ncbi:MAG: hypothetical protein H6576_09395 [Lewinellaceae bacterium]|nr:hypothetical protein [Saprospiraceae bacterium]MCB9343900.1 hypothetical protein [Lewinellaceae bacterium]